MHDLVKEASKLEAGSQSSEISDSPMIQDKKRCSIHGKRRPFASSQPSQPTQPDPGAAWHRKKPLQKLINDFPEEPRRKEAFPTALVPIMKVHVIGKSFKRGHRTRVFLAVVAS